MRNADDVYRKASQKNRNLVAGEEDRESGQTEKRQDIGRMMGAAGEHAYRRTRAAPQPLKRVIVVA